MKARKRRQNAMMKPTHDCNLRCDYCFVEKLTEEYGHQKMDFDTLNQAYKVLSNTADEVQIIWHGGEPTLMGADWYRKAIELSYLYSDKTVFKHSMQSNGVLLNDDWIDLIINYGVDLAISYDGLFQDKRKFGSKDLIEKNLLKLKEVRGRVSCLSVVTENSYKGMLDNYKYFRENGIDASFNYGINGKYDDHGNYKGIPLDDYMKEYLKYFKYWLNDREGYREKSCMQPLELILGIGGNCCNLSDCRNQWLNINPDGSLTPCNRYFPEKFGMGNINDFTHVGDVYETDNYKNFSSEISERFNTECNTCEYLTYCNGGCQSQHLMNTGSVTKVDKSYCERFKLEFTHVYKILRNVDIYTNNNLNLNFLEILNEGIFTPKEVKDFLLFTGINPNNLEFDSEDILNCKEFKIFRIFNPKIRGIGNAHLDKINFPKVNFSEFRNITSDPAIRNKRLYEMDSIFESKKELIFKILEN